MLTQVAPRGLVQACKESITVGEIGRNGSSSSISGNSSLLAVRKIAEEMEANNLCFKTRAEKGVWHGQGSSLYWCGPKVCLVGAHCCTHMYSVEAE